MSLSVSDSGVTLMVAADRPETMDLMRRHSSELSAAFREMGYENIAFSFGTGGDTGSPHDDEGGHSASGGRDPDDMQHQMAASQPAPRSPASSHGDGGLDMRL